MEREGETERERERGGGRERERMSHIGWVGGRERGKTKEREDRAKESAREHRAGGWWGEDRETERKGRGRG